MARIVPQSASESNFLFVLDTDVGVVVQFAPMESRKIIDLPCTAGDLKAALRGVDDTAVIDIDSEFRRVYSIPGVSHVRVEMLVARDAE